MYPVCRSLVDPGIWKKLMNQTTEGERADRMPDILDAHRISYQLPEFIADLARLEEALFVARTGAASIPDVARFTINPTVRLLELSWKNLLPYAQHISGNEYPRPEEKTERILVWVDPSTGRERAKVAVDEDMLVLKMIAEDVDAHEIASMGDVPLGAVDAAVDRAVENRLVLSPPPRIRRDPVFFPSAGVAGDRYLSSEYFTLQWHITNACDLHCKHCYDRSTRGAVSLAQGYSILNDLREFCRNKHVHGQVSFTGGNPLLHPHFLELYEAAVNLNLTVAIMGNPASREMLDEIVSISSPSFFQVSLEGLEEHNDSIRGEGNFRNVLEFLDELKDAGIYSQVMLTLTRDNIDEVIALTDVLKGKADAFNFNRLSLVGEGEHLSLPDLQRYRDFLNEYLDAARNNPVMQLKDNLINIIRYQAEKPVFGGCTGFGCGAAFNFLALLPDGEVHACRKFPSLLGNLNSASLLEVYDSEIAGKYRSGSIACAQCPIRCMCGGCLAVASSTGHDIFSQRDPFCFMDLEE